jgi:hypothetical protein
VGSVQLAEVIDNPEFDLVGLFVYSPARPSGRGAGDRPIGANPHHGR